MNVLFQKLDQEVYIKKQPNYYAYIENYLICMY